MKQETSREQLQTIRRQMIDLLSLEELSAMEVSRSLGIREKEVYEHLGNIARSLATQGKKLIILPFRCLKCGYAFTARKRFNRPSRCPRCKNTHIQSAKYTVE